MPRKAYSYGRAQNNSRAAACVAGYLNPMRDVVQNIKIPDGNSNLSCPIRRQSQSIIKNTADQQTYILIRPNYNYGIGYWTQANSDSNLISVDQTLTDTNKMNVTTYNPTIDQGDIHSFRVVSQAARISTTMNSDNNQGYFEAFRVSTQEGVHNITLTNMVSDPSYINGKLKDIHRYLFQLKPRSTDHDFQLVTASDFTDDQYDSILIRMSGMSETAGTILINCISHQEYQFRDNSDKRMFMDGSVTDLNGLRSAQAKLQSSVRAGVLTSYI